MNYKVLASGEKLFNPMEDEKDEKMTATALNNDKEGNCPKCSNNMGTALSGSETVWFCENCRVSSPLSK